MFLKGVLVVKTQRWVTWVLPAAGLLLLVAGYFTLLQPVEYANARRAPAVVGRQLDGKWFDLSTLRDKRAALLVFWASW